MSDDAFCQTVVFHLRACMHTAKPFNKGFADYSVEIVLSGKEDYRLVEASCLSQEEIENTVFVDKSERSARGGAQ